MSKKINNKKTYNNDKNNGQYIDGRTLKNYYCIEPNCNNKISYTNWLYGNKRCQSCAVKYLYKLGILNFKGKDSPNFGKKYSEETRRKMNISHGGNGLFKYERLPNCIDCEKQLGDPRSKRCHSCNAKKQHREKLFNYNRTPTKPEKILNRLLLEIFSKEYKYVGNNKIIIDGLNPDFINVNSQKKIIELFGCYWHKCKKCGFGKRNLRINDKRKLKTYAKYGYKTLIIWEHEVKNTKKLEKKILDFNEL